MLATEILGDLGYHLSAGGSNALDGISKVSGIRYPEPRCLSLNPVRRVSGVIPDMPRPLPHCSVRRTNLLKKLYG